MFNLLDEHIMREPRNNQAVNYERFVFFADNLGVFRGENQPMYG